MPVSVLDLGLSPLSLTAPTSWADSESEGSISPRRKARSCSEKERSRFRGVGELSALLSSPLSGDSSSCGVEGATLGGVWSEGGKTEQQDKVK